MHESEIIIHSDASSTELTSVVQLGYEDIHNLCSTCLLDILGRYNNVFCVLADTVRIAKIEHICIEIAHSLSYDGLEGLSISTWAIAISNLVNLSISNSGHGCSCARPFV